MSDTNTAGEHTPEPQHMVVENSARQSPREQLEAVILSMSATPWGRAKAVRDIAAVIDQVVIAELEALSKVILNFKPGSQLSVTGERIAALKEKQQ